MLIILNLAIALLILAVPENLYPFVLVRSAFGLMFTLFLPGYSLINAVFKADEMDNLQRATFGIAMSIVLAIVVGILLNYTPWGINTVTVTLCLLAISIFSLTIAALNKYNHM